MSLINCQKCGHEISDTVSNCPNCGDYKFQEETPQKLSTGLIIGIIFIPEIFAWFTLKKGISTKTRIISLTYMVLQILTTIFYRIPHMSQG